MKILPGTRDALVLRTDFSDESAWGSICAAMQQPVDGFRASVECVSDPQYERATLEQLLECVPDGYRRTFLLVVDATTIAHPEHPILVMDLYTHPGRTFRVIPSEMWGVENNLSLANMDFAEFADAADTDGVFRGFR